MTKSIAASIPCLICQPGTLGMLWCIYWQVKAIDCFFGKCCIYNNLCFGPLGPITLAHDLQHGKAYKLFAVGRRGRERIRFYVISLLSMPYVSVLLSDYVPIGKKDDSFLKGVCNGW
jgi:hypothetical protein